MPNLVRMPAITVTPAELLPFGTAWTTNRGRLSRTPPNSSLELGNIFDSKVGNALAIMLGGIPVIKPNANSLIPSNPNCVEVGPCRIIGGIRPQNFDVGYRPDGVRFAFDSKTLNDSESVGKNYQNMINDLGTEATTVHTRYPYAIVAFLVIIPTPCLVSPQREALVETLERLTQRQSPLDSNHKAEVISLIVWEPTTGKIEKNLPVNVSPLRIENFSDQVGKIYKERYKGLPPHD